MWPQFHGLLSLRRALSFRWTLTVTGWSNGNAAHFDSLFRTKLGYTFYMQRGQSGQPILSNDENLSYLFMWAEFSRYLTNQRSTPFSFNFWLKLTLFNADFRYYTITAIFSTSQFYFCDSPCNGQWVLFYFRTFKCNWNIFIHIGVYHILPCCNGWIHAFCAYRIIASNALCHRACRSVSRDN